MSPVEQANQLRANGLSYNEIAAQIGVSCSTVRRWVNPEYAERSRAAARAWKRSHKGTCVDCGAPTSLGNSRRPGPAERCKRCAAAFYPPIYREAKRGKGPTVSRLFAFLADSERSYTAIRLHLGLTAPHTAVLLNRQVGYGLVERVRRGVYRRPIA